jgi:predicted O-methyltransferase YrrM
MDITKKILELNPEFQRHNEGFWDEPFDPEKTTFSSFNDAGIEVETGEFLYAIARLLKPEHVLETGTHFGVGATYMGMALKENRKGDLTTIEFLPEIHARAQQNIHRAGLQQIVTCRLDNAMTFQPGETKYALILLDTEPQTRFEELVKFLPNLEEGGYIFIHDLHRHMHQIDNSDHGFAWPFGTVPNAINEMVQSGKLRPMHFPTPRGLTGFYKPHSGDHNFATVATEKRYKIGQ